MAQAAPHPGEELGWDIISAVSDERDVDPTDIDERLYDVIDVESLERVIRRGNEDKPVDLSVSFRLAGCFVTVTGDGEVRARRPG